MATPSSSSNTPQVVALPHGHERASGSHRRVQIFSPQGQQIGTIQAPGAANVAFGGPERRTLFITATTQLLAVDLAIPGLPY